jgi:heptosyltransferase-2
LAGRILVIRGGAIGDFILTLPAIKLIRDELPDAEVHLLGYRHIMAVAEGRFYARSATSIEYAALAPFFSRGAELPEQLMEFFAGFHQIVSYLFDPDSIFLTNLERCGAKDVIVGNPRIGNDSHAAEQLAAPLERLAMFLEDPVAHVYPNADDFAEAEKIWAGGEVPSLVIHPGSGSPKKNWPLEHWVEFIRMRLAAHPDETIGIVTGESDESARHGLGTVFGRERRVRFAPLMSLPTLAAALARAGRFVGHDSGISHLAAAAGAECILLFGPTDPSVWAPAGNHVRVICAPGGALSALQTEAVFGVVEERWT